MYRLDSGAGFRVLQGDVSPPLFLNFVAVPDADGAVPRS